MLIFQLKIFFFVLNINILHLNRELTIVKKQQLIKLSLKLKTLSKHE